MKKQLKKYLLKIIIITFILNVAIAKGQETKTLKTAIILNEKIGKNVTLILFDNFEEHELKSVQCTLTDDYINISYNEQSKSITINTLKVFETTELIVTTNKIRYIIPLKYGNNPTTNFVLKYQNETSIKKEIIRTAEPLKNFTIKWTENEKNLLKISTKLFKNENSNHNIKLILEEILNFKNEFYFILKVKNNSTISYVLDKEKMGVYFESNKSDINGSKSYDIIPIYNKYFNPSNNKKTKIINPKEYIKIIHKIDKLTIEKNKYLKYNIYEKNGVRNLELKIPSQLINNPIFVKKDFSIKIPKKSKHKYSIRREDIDNSKASLFLNGIYLPKNSNIQIGYQRIIKKSSFSYYTRIHYVSTKTSKTTIADFKEETINRKYGLGIGASYKFYQTNKINANFSVGTAYNIDKVFLNKSKKTIANENNILFETQLKINYRLSNKFKIGIAPILYYTKGESNLILNTIFNINLFVSVNL